MGNQARSDGLAAAAVLGEMRARHAGGYARLAGQLETAIRNYYERAAVVETSILIVGLSGGIDSSLVTFLAVRAVGRNHVYPVTLPVWADTAALRRASEVRESLGFDAGDRQFTISIQHIVEREYAAMNATSLPALRIETVQDQQQDIDRRRLGNFAARARVAVFYDLASALRGRVLGTGNRTEFVQGYSAKYGTPLSYDFGVLDDLYKVDIEELAALVGIPETVKQAVPTTGYFPGQTHEQELGMPLAVQDALAFLFFERNCAKAEAIDRYGFAPETVELMLRRYSQAEHKRRLQPEHIQLIDV